MAKLPAALSSRRDADVLDGSSFEVAARDARANFKRLLDWARIDRARMVITAHSEPAAAVVPISDLRILTALDQLHSTEQVATLAVKLANKQLSNAEFATSLTEVLRDRAAAG